VYTTGIGDTTTLSSVRGRVCKSETGGNLKERMIKKIPRKWKRNVLVSKR
jgi:hypothetical protein